MPSKQQGWTAAAIVFAASVVIICRHKDNFIRLKNGRLLNEYMMVKTLEREKE